MRSTNVPAYDIALYALVMALRGLDGTEGRPIARRNARRRVLGALRKVRAVVDEKAPAIIMRGKVTRLKTTKGRIARLEARGWISIAAAMAGALAAHGVSVRRVVDEQGHGHLFVPTWAHEIGAVDGAKLREALKSVKLRRAVLAEKALRESRA